MVTSGPSVFAFRRLKPDGTHCSKTLKRCLKIFLIRTNKNKIAYYVLHSTFLTLSFCFSPETTFLFVVTSRVTQLFTRQTAIFQQN